jgi:hypothetical protein
MSDNIWHHSVLVGPVQTLGLLLTKWRRWVHLWQAVSWGLLCVCPLLLLLRPYGAKGVATVSYTNAHCPFFYFLLSWLSVLLR